MDEIKIPECLHCGIALKTLEEIDDNVCASCKTSLYCDENIKQD